MPIIKIAHSPDADDFFLFWALREGRISTSPYELRFTTAHTEALNEAARMGNYDICAVSAGALPCLSDTYAVLSSGASVGRGYGPVLVSKSPLSLSDLAGKRVAVPGKSTTAAKLLHILCPDAKQIEVPIEPFDNIFLSLERQEVDAALLIHEGQTLYRKRALHLVSDLGVWWTERTNLPLVVGVNVIRRNLDRQILQSLSALCEHSILWALEHTDEILSELTARNQNRGILEADERSTRDYLARYANQDSVRLSPEALQSLSYFCESVAPGTALSLCTFQGLEAIAPARLAV